MSRISLVMTVLGPDRPGIVESLAQTVAENGGNWIESRMAHLAGQFAGILRVEVTADRANLLAEALGQLRTQGLELVIHSDDVSTPFAKETTGLAQLELVGQDRPGILSEITHVLATHGVNVEDLTTRCVTAPTTGQQLFQASAELRLPSAHAERELRKELEKIAGDLMVDITFGPAGDKV